MQKLRPIMFVGTGSDVGKSVINAAFCRILLQDGYSPAPFKAQNMSLNSYATPEGLEIGRAQAVQAEACGIPCSVEMNPVLLKPTGDLNSQVVLNGKPIGNKSATEYFNTNNRNELFGEVMKSFRVLNEKFNPVVIEGAGSISEMNLWDKDIVNMPIAEKTGACTYLVADIDKGGVFASVYGSIDLLPPKQKDCIKGIIINKFRGDISLFGEGKKILENLTGKPVVGIIPYFRDIFIEQEDSVVISSKTSTSSEGKINIAVVLLKHMSNFTDFNMLEQIPNVHLFYAHEPKEILNADIAIIPGSKNSISDLQYLWQSGIAKSLIAMHNAGKPVYGICGGYQMMGKEISDPDHVEGNLESIPGLGILPVWTKLSKKKKTEQCQFTFLNNPKTGQGYEIHMGETFTDNKKPLCKINGTEDDGYYLDAKTWGTYIHGIFDNEFVINEILKQAGSTENVNVDYAGYKNAHYDKLAQLVRDNIDLEKIYSTLRYD